MCEALAGILFGTILVGTFFLGFLAGRSVSLQEAEVPSGSRGS